jgi:hypothetical protein
VVNSRKSVNFTSANGDRLRVNSGMVFTNSVTAIVFIKPGSQNYAYANILDQDHGMDGANGWVIQRNNDASAWLSWVANAAGDTWFNPNQILYVDNTPQIVTLRKGSSTVTLYSNGTSSTDVAIADQQIRQVGYLGLNIGSWRAGNELFSSSRHYNGEICEIVVYNRALSLTELKQVHTYLGQKWGVSNTDRSVIDLAGNDDNGLLGNGSTSNMPLYDFYNKGAFKFFASNKYIKLGISTVVNQFAGDFTVSLWAMATAENSNWGNLIGDYYTAGTPTTAEWQIMMHNSSAFLFLYRVGTGYVIADISSGFSANTWINVVVTRIGTAVTLYANNNVIGTATNSLVFGSATGNVNIGVDGNNSAEPFSGLISNVLIYRKGLSAVEVAQNYEAQKSKFANTIVQQGLVLNLDAGNIYSYAGAGATWYDVSGNSFNATLINSPTYTSDNGGVLNWASANSQYATVPMSSTLRVANITQEAWVYLSGTADQVFIGSQYGTSSNNSFAIWVQSGAFAFGVNTGGNFYYSTISTVSTGVWYNLTHTYNATTQLFYINGVLAATYNSAASGNISYDTSNTLLAIGADFNGTGYNVGPGVYTNGKMPVVRIYNIALSAAQVLQNYNATKGRFGL